MPCIGKQLPKSTISNGMAKQTKSIKNNNLLLNPRKTIKNFGEKRNSNAIASFDQVESNFKKYFADPIDLRSVKKSCKTVPIQTGSVGRKKSNENTGNKTYYCSMKK